MIVAPPDNDTFILLESCVFYLFYFVIIYLKLFPELIAIFVDPYTESRRYLCKSCSEKLKVFSHIFSWKRRCCWWWWASVIYTIVLELMGTIASVESITTQWVEGGQSKELMNGWGCEWKRIKRSCVILEIIATRDYFFPLLLL